MKVHIGADAETGLVHSIEVTSANVCDVTMTDKLIRSEDRFVIGDAGYRGSEKRTSHADVAFIIAMMRSKRKLIEGTFRDQFEKALSGIRSKVEHVFRIIKDQFNYRKVRYRGLAKNKHSMIVKIALANIYQARKYLIQRA